MRKLLLLLSLYAVNIATGQSVTSTKSNSEFEKSNSIDLVHPKDFEILKIENFSGTPNDKGILKSYSIKLPDFEKAVYYGSDGREITGVVPSNRGYMWILDNQFGLISDPVVKKTAGTYGGKPTSTGTFSVFKLKDGRFLAVLPLVGEKSMGYFDYKKGSLPQLNIATFGTAKVDGQVPILAYAIGNNIYEASQKVWNNVIKSDLKGISAKLRSEKVYPEYWKYLGWCSWEEYRDMIDEKLMKEAMENIYASGLPIRWVLVDEGPQSYQGTRKDRFSVGLHSFEVDKKKFPNGLSPLMKYKKEDGIKWMGIWQHQAGLYKGIDPNNTMGAEMNKNFEKMPSGNYMAKADFKSQYAFFEGLFGYTKEAGFDFVKIDFQGPQFLSYKGSENAVYAHTQTTKALEAICKDNNWGLMNCFANDITWAFNSSQSLVTRASQDYRSGKPSAARIQTYQCYNNKLWMSNIVWGDHDMFHSNDTLCNRMMAVSKAVAGAPVYISDAPKEFVKDVITPLCYKDGELIRPVAPALPLPESFFVDPIYAKNMYRVIAPLTNGAASIVCYNIYDGDAPITLKGKITKKDYVNASATIQPYPGEWKLPKEGLIAFDYYSKIVYDLKEDVDVELTGLEDKLFHLLPIEYGWAIIGNTGKYLSPSTITEPKYTEAEISFKVKEEGEVAIYLKSGLPKSEGLQFVNKGNGLWLCNVPKNKVNTVITILKKK